MNDIPEGLAGALADRYTIERPIGEGGMATVYLADDAKHGRKVAVKVLKPELAAVIGAERFLSEIQTTASLQHPHILPLFESGEAGAFLYYVMPYVEGESLRDRLDRETQLPVEEALTIAKAMASALDYAHRRDIIHRDIKPANILLHDGQPVIADFGIALAVSAAGGGRLTETGLSLGTPHYMSPEQASADRELSVRSDVYALGCVLYEMLAGLPPFSGPTAQSILMQILTEEAKPITAHRKSVPANVSSALARALEKLPADRFASADEFGKALDEPGFVHDSGTGVHAAALGRRQWLRDPRTLALAALTALVAVFGALTRGDAPIPANVLHFNEQLPADVSLSRRDLVRTLAVSPDGSDIFLVIGGGGARGAGVWRRSMDQRQYAEVPGVEGVVGVMVSPDGASLGLFTRRGLATAPVEGGVMTPLDVGPTGQMGFWGEDDRIYYLDRAGDIRRVSVTGGEPELVHRSSEPTTPVAGALLVVASPRALVPGSEALLVMVLTAPDFDAFHVGIVPSPGDSIRVIARGIEPLGFVGDRYIIGRSNDGTAMAVPFDPSKLEADGPAVALPLQFGNNSQFGLTDALMVYQEGTGYDRNRLVTVTRDGAETDLGAPPREYLFPRFSPDGRRVAMEIHDDLGGQIWVLELGSGALNVLTSQGHNTRPLWYPDGSRLLYSRGTGFYSIRADGGGDEELVWGGPTGFTDSAWLPDGRLLFGLTNVEADGSRHDDLVTIRPGEASDPEPFLATSADESVPSVSPDGEWVAYLSDNTGSTQLYVTPSSGDGARLVVSTEPARDVAWGNEGLELLYRTDTGFYSAKLDFVPEFSVERSQLLESERYFEFSSSAAYAMDPRSSDFLFIRPPEGSVELLCVIFKLAAEVEGWVGGGGE